MQTNTTSIADRLRSLRIAKALKQSDIDRLSNLPRSSTSKIETKKREATADELIRIARALGVSLETFAGECTLVYQEEIKIIEALRVIPFEDYQQILRTLEARVYFQAKDSSEDDKKYLRDLVCNINKMSLVDRRPRTGLANVKRVKGKG